MADIRNSETKDIVKEIKFIVPDFKKYFLLDDLLYSLVWAITIQTRERDRDRDRERDREREVSILFHIHQNGNLLLKCFVTT